MRHYKPFQFKQFSIAQNNAAMKVGTDSVLLGAWANIYPNEKVLDIGTGTGLLSLMLAQKVDGHCTIDAIEIEKGAALDAKLNFNNSNWPKSLTLHNLDFNDFNSNILYDLIISNPPFFEGLAPEITSRSIARNASDKLSYKSLLTNASTLLSKEGRIMLIIPYEYFEKVIRIGNGLNLFLSKQLNIRPKKDKPINRVLIEFCNKPTDLTKEGEELIIRDKNNQYTEEHIAFTKDFYLNLR